MNIKTLVQEFCDYSLFIRGYSPNTVVNYRSATKYFSKVSGITEIEDITEKSVKSFFLFGRVERNWKPRTFIGYHKTLIVFFRWCVENGHMEINFIDDIEVPKIEKKLPPKLTKQEVLKLLDIIYNYPYDYKFLRYRNYAIFSMFVFAGLRKSELLNLKLTDVDIENLSIFVRQGKGSKDRVVPISYTLARRLERYLKERKRLKKTCSRFFASLNRNQGFTDSGLKHLIRQMNEVSGIKFYSHKLRHTFATLMLEGGCDIYSLSRMMGHSNIKTTTIYLMASAEHLRSQMTKHPLNDLV